MAEIRKTNIFQYLKTKYNNVASIVKMNGTQSAGSSDYIARADHVHPTDTSRAASNHSHGSLVNDGALNSDITSVNKVAVTDATNKLKTISKLPLDKVTHQDISGKANINHSHLSNDIKIHHDIEDGMWVYEYGINRQTDVNCYVYDHEKKLENIDDGANKTVVDSSLSGSSTNPVQNKVVNSALNGKSDIGHEHTSDDIHYALDQNVSVTTMLENKAPKNHTHDDRYYTETEMDSKLNGKANSSHTHTASQISDLTVSTHTLANGAKLYKYGKIVMCVLFNVAFSGKTAHTWNDLFTNIPSTYQPIGGTNPIYAHSSEILLSVQGSTIQIYPYKTSGSVFNTLVWITA